MVSISSISTCTRSNFEVMPRSRSLLRASWPEFNDRQPKIRVAEGIRLAVAWIIPNPMLRLPPVTRIIVILAKLLRVVGIVGILVECISISLLIYTSLVTRHWAFLCYTREIRLSNENVNPRMTSLIPGKLRRELIV